jgi:3-dehydroquinate synthetase
MCWDLLSGTYLFFIALISPSVTQVPTTLMAVVDASIGIKTAVNFHSKKNKLGTYSPPLGVFYDTTFLSTLDERNISNGAAEIMKMACIKDRELFELMEEHAEELVQTRFQVCRKGVGAVVLQIGTCLDGLNCSHTCCS